MTIPTVTPATKSPLKSFEFRIWSVMSLAVLCTVVAGILWGMVGPVAPVGALLSVGTVLGVVGIVMAYNNWLSIHQSAAGIIRP